MDVNMAERGAMIRASLAESTSLSDEVAESVVILATFDVDDDWEAEKPWMP